MEVALAARTRTLARLLPVLELVQNLGMPDACSVFAKFSFFTIYRLPEIRSGRNVLEISLMPSEIFLSILEPWTSVRHRKMFQI